MKRNSGTHIPSWEQEYDRHISALVQRHGWAVQYVGGVGTTPPFAYTIGLFGLDHPELIVFGLDYESACGILNEMGERVRHNDVLSPGDVITLSGFLCRVRVDVFPHPERALFAVSRFYRRAKEQPVPALQLTWDVDGAFPDDPGYTKPVWLQPMPGEYRG